MSFWVYLLMSVFMFLSVILILLVLIQKGRGGGLSSAFGGAGGNTAFGSKTGDVLTWATSVVFAFFVIFAVLLNLAIGTSGKPKTPAANSGTPPVSSNK